MRPVHVNRLITCKPTRVSPSTEPSVGLGQTGENRACLPQGQPCIVALQTGSAPGLTNLCSHWPVRLYSISLLLSLIPQNMRK